LGLILKITAQAFWAPRSERMAKGELAMVDLNKIAENVVEGKV
jgi:hypothetical protein